jgi:ankyrin repeat protein
MATTKSTTADLAKAVSKGSFNDIQALVEKGADINAQDKYGYTPLLHALKNKQEQITKFLVEKGANVNLCDMNGVSPLRMAEARSSIEIVQTLKKLGAELQPQQQPQQVIQVQTKRDQALGR